MLFRSCLKATLTALLRQAPPKHTFLPHRGGGLGAFLAEERHAETFLRGQERALRTAKKFFPELGTQIADALAERASSPLGRACAAARAMLPDTARSNFPTLAELSSMKDTEARTVGEKLKAAVTAHLKGVALRALPPLQQQILVLSSLPGAAAWLTVTPRFPHLTLSDEEARAAACIRLGLPHACLAGVGGEDRLGRHALRKKGAGRIATHGVLITVLAKFSRRAHRSVEVEVVGLYGPYPQEQRRHHRNEGEMRRMDLIVMHDVGTMAMTDGTLADGAAPSLLLRSDALQAPHRALEEAERRKDKKYLADKPPNSTFSTFAIGTQCELGEQAKKWLMSWAEDVAKAQLGANAVVEKSYLRKLVWGALQELGVAIMKAQAKQIFDHAALATRRRFNLPRAGPAAALMRASGRQGRARGGR